MDVVAIGLAAWLRVGSQRRATPAVGRRPVADDQAARLVRVLGPGVVDHRLDELRRQVDGGRAGMGRGRRVGREIGHGTDRTGRIGTARSDELVGEQVHQQPVVPRAVAPAFVPPHRPDRSEPDGGVGPDRPLVRGGGIDRQAVVATPLDEPARDRPDRVAAAAAALAGRDDGDVDAGVAVLRVVSSDAMTRPIGAPSASMIQIASSSSARSSRDVAGRVGGLPPGVDGRVDDDPRNSGLVARRGRPEVDELAVERFDGLADRWPPDGPEARARHSAGTLTTS